jgi:hypothetical protein
MGVRSAFLFVIVLLIAALAALNWGTLAAPNDVWLGFMTVSAPLGLIMLGLTVVLAAFFLVYVLYLHSSVLLDTKRHTKEMQVQRDLADKAEASRFTELRNFLEAQENKHMAHNADRHMALVARIDQLETRCGCAPSRPTTRWPRTSASSKTASSAGRWWSRPTSILRVEPLNRSARRVEPPQRGVASTQAASFFASASLTWLFAGIGTGPHTPEPPFTILVARACRRRPCRPCTSWPRP